MRPNRIFIFLSVLITADFCLAQAIDESQTVEITYPVEVADPYKERRRDHGIGFAVNLEKYYPKDMESIVDEELFYSDTFGKHDIDMYRVEAGYLYKISLGSVGLLGSYAYGTISDTTGIETRGIEATHYRLSAMYVMDTIMDEPYIAPYIQGHFGKFQISESLLEKASAGESTYTTTVLTSFSMGYTVGALFQLNWLDKESALRALVDGNIENTYIDVFFTQYMKSMDAEDINVASGLNWGAGLRLEF